VTLRAGFPLAARFGDWVGWLSVAGLLALNLRPFGRQQRASRGHAVG
jgi:hypothetical protein